MVSSIIILCSQYQDILAILYRNRGYSIIIRDMRRWYRCRGYMSTQPEWLATRTLTTATKAGSETHLNFMNTVS